MKQNGKHEAAKGWLRAAQKDNLIASVFAGTERPAPKTGAERVADHNARLRDQGLKQVRSLWAHPDDVPAIRECAAKLLRKRLKGKK